MPTYLMLLRYTQSGIQNVKDSPSRLDAARQLARSMGGDIKTIYLTMGRYDIVAIIEAPDDDVAAKFAVMTGMQGNVSTETMRALNEGEFDRLLKSL